MELSQNSIILRTNFIVVDAYIKNEEISQINNLTLTLSY